ncbi:MAG: DUF349 domain-containing protein [Stagnimonas sp.]|nr:DUF349 domain-containing protein [Stagnimonas sp.]
MALDAGDMQAVARLVVAGASTKVRQAAAQAIEDADLLRQLIREVRGGNDKSVYKVLTSKRDLLVEKARKHEQLQAEIAAAAADFERHTQRPYDISYKPLLDQFETRWEAVAAEAEAALREKVEQCIDRSRETIAAHLREAAAQASRELAATQAATEAQQLRQQQLQAEAAVAAEQERALDEQRRAQAEQQQVEQQAVRQLGEMIRKARGALSDGSTARAAVVRRAIEQQLVGAPPLPANLVGQLQLLDKQLEELKDWKLFSVTPKRAELIEAMELLIDATLDPLPLAERIKSLQEQWRTLGKGAGENDEADQQRFKDATQKAYQPCRAYFAAQALILQENLQRRDALLAKLTAFEAEQHGEQADWRLVANMLRETKAAWRLITPVDPRAGRPQQEAFVALTARLKDRLDTEYARNLEQKAALIERARALLGSDDSRQAIDAIKSLQQSWRAVGPVPREADQRLWEEFRQHCDAVFQKRQQASVVYAAELDHNKMQAIDLCEQLEKMAASDAPELLARTTLEELRSAFETLGELPPADARELRKRFDRGLDRCQASVARQQARDVEQAWSDLFEAANHVRAYRLGVARHLETEQIDRLKAAAEASIAAGQRWPKNAVQALKEALVSERSDELAQNDAALRMLCIRAEILTDQPTPPEDQALRREYQLQRLVQRMGQGGKADDTPLDTLAIEWVGIGPVESAAYQPLLQRFRRCREQGSSRAR